MEAKRATAPPVQLTGAVDTRTPGESNSAFLGASVLSSPENGGLTYPTEQIPGVLRTPLKGEVIFPATFHEERQQEPWPLGCPGCGGHALSDVGGGQLRCDPDDLRAWKTHDGQVVEGYGCGQTWNVGDITHHFVQTEKSITSPLSAPDPRLAFLK